MRRVRLTKLAPLAAVLALGAGATAIAQAPPEPGATPYPACWANEFNQPSSPAPSGSAGPSATASAPVGEVIKESATQIQFDGKDLSAPADVAFQIEFTNNDAGIPHNIEIKDASGASVSKGDIFNGVETRTYTVNALPAGAYTFICTVHPNMIGTLTVGG